jgi:clathrin heavy chain
MDEKLRIHIRQNLQTVIQIAAKYSDTPGLAKSIELFELSKTFEGMVWGLLVHFEWYN